MPEWADASLILDARGDLRMDGTTASVSVSWRARGQHRMRTGEVRTEFLPRPALSSFIFSPSDLQRIVG